ncbi:MAG: alpha/beta fold hydrolase [Paracoccaceae bacterium]
MSELSYLDVPGFILQKGGYLPQVRMAYRTVGTLSAARDNAVLVPSWYAGTEADSEACLVGKDRALDPSKYFIILTNLLAGGVSSSPSNTPAPFERGRFPKITLQDNVRLQHKLVTEVLGLERLRLVTGVSMGACQSYQWASQYPDMVQTCAPIAGSARTASYNKVFLLSLRRALQLDPVFNDGFYERPPIGGLRAFAAIYAGWGLSEPFYRKAAFADFSARDHEEFVAHFWEPLFQKCDANDLMSQLWTWEKGDISDNPTYGGDLTAALSAIKARTIILSVDLDRYFPPEDAKAEAGLIPNAECRVIRSDWGHMAPSNPADLLTIDAALRDLLEG